MRANSFAPWIRADRIGGPFHRKYFRLASLGDRAEYHPPLVVRFPRSVEPKLEPIPAPPFMHRPQFALEIDDYRLEWRERAHETRKGEIVDRWPVYIYIPKATA